MRPLVIDNFDSFTYNLVHMLESISQTEVEVLRPPAVSDKRLDEAPYVVFSPGPGLPTEHPRLMDLVYRILETDKKALGVCLGQQAFAVATGGSLKNLETVYHGVARNIEVDTGAALFRGLESVIEVARYHSWVVDDLNPERDWRVDARDANGEIMAISHRHKPIFGVQFHPESVLTPLGGAVLRNFLND